MLADAANLSRSLLISQIIESNVPVIVALNMMDIAEDAGLEINVAQLARELGCPFIPIIARTGRGLDELRRAILQLRSPSVPPGPVVTCTACSDCRFKTRYA